MGMDVYGRENEEAYFRANVWSWRPLHVLICEANERFSLGIPKKTLEYMKFNQGAGLESQAECDRLAEALEVILQEHGEVISLDMEPQGPEAVLLKLLRKHFKEDPAEAYLITREHVEMFIEFLRECGGFEVW